MRSRWVTFRPLGKLKWMVVGKPSYGTSSYNQFTGHQPRGRMALARLLRRAG